MTNFPNYFLDIGLNVLIRAKSIFIIESSEKLLKNNNSMSDDEKMMILEHKNVEWIGNALNLTGM